MSALVVVSNVHFETFRSSRDLVEQTIDEMIILLCSYTFYIFRMVSLEQNYMIGYYSIGLILFYMVCSLGYVLAGNIKALKASLRRRMIMRNYQKSRQQLRRKLAETREVRLSHFWQKRMINSVADVTLESESSQKHDQSSSSIDNSVKEESKRINDTVI